MGLNTVTIMGRISNDLELRKTPAGKSVMSFNVAVDKTVSGERYADFIPVVAWDKTAEFITSYFSKGKMICVEGRLQTRMYEAEGQKRFVMEVVADRVHFTGEKKEDATQSNIGQKSEDFTLSEIANDDDLPF